MNRLFILLLLPLSSAGQRSYSAMLDSFMQAEVSVNNFNGNVLVAKSGRVIYQKAFGYRNYDTKEALDNNSTFELQSITKEFTAMGILLLKERRKLTLKDSLRKFFPELPYSKVTIQHMLTHTSGLPDDMEVMSANWNHKVIASNNDLVKILAEKNIPANFRPGEKWEYSNTAFELLASIIEKVSGDSYTTFIEKYIFNPLEMHFSYATTNATKSKQSIPNYAYGFIYSDSLKKYISPALLPETDFVVYLEGTYGAGNISSSTGDLWKWDRAIKNHTLLSEGTQNEMHSPQSLMDTISKRYYGYGEILGANEMGNYILRGGGWPGYHTMLVRYLTNDITIIILSNNESNSTMLAGALAYIVTDRDVVPSYKHASIPINNDLLDRYVGNYMIPNVPNPTIIKLFKKDGKLFRSFENSSTSVELKPESVTKFFDADSDSIQIEFEVDDSGKITKAFFVGYNMKKEIKKIN